MIPAIGVAAFFLLLNTAPLNAAVINSVGAHIRATALAVNIFIIHILGDVPSPAMMGWGGRQAVAAGSFYFAGDRHGDLLRHTVLWNKICAARRGGRTAPPGQGTARQDGIPPLDRGNDSRPGVAFPALWMLPLACLPLRTFSRPEWNRNPVSPSGNPRVSIIVPARNEEETVAQALNTMLALDYDNYEVIAVNDRSTDSTGEILERIEKSPRLAPVSRGTSTEHPSLRVIHHRELPAGWLGKTHAMWTAANQAQGRLAAVH